MTATTEPSNPPDPAAAFLRHLPRIAAHAAFALRHVRSPDRREDLAAEVVALAWKWFRRLTARGKHPERFVTTLALRCSQAVRSGRRLASPDRAKDVLSPVAKARHGVAVESLDDVEALALHLSDALAADTRTPVPRQVAFRLDFPAWRGTFGGRTRRILDALAAGDRTTDVARRFGVSPPRIAQYRREFESSWRAFHAPDVTDDP